MKRRIGILLTLFFLSLCSAKTAWALTHVVIVSGLGGDSEYEESFRSSATAIAESFTPGSVWTGGEAQVKVFSGADVSGPDVIAEIDTIAEQISTTDRFVLMLVGHGSYDGEHYRFNIPGPDLTDHDLKHAVDRIKAEQQLIVLATSASGVMLQQLEKPGRIVITATKSGGEINAVVFPQFWAAALTTVKADLDRNEIVTVSEAFDFTQKAVDEHYKERNLLASEHARMLGDEAEQQPIALIGSLRNVGSNPKVAELLTQRTELETQFKALIATKSESTQVEYYAKLKTLMLQFARLQRSLDRETGWLNTSE